MTVLPDTDFGYNSPELTDEARAVLWGAWSVRGRRGSMLRRWRDYAEGRGGIPELEDGASDELKELASLAPLNLCGVVVDAFDRASTVVGFRSPKSADDDPAWSLWQSNFMDARQSEVHRAALIYGEAYVSVLPDDARDGAPTFATWSPLDVVVEFDDPRRDLFPTSAVLLRRAVVDGQDGYSALIVDDMTVTPARLLPGRWERGRSYGLRRSDIVEAGDPWVHGATYRGRPVCPVVRFVNERVTEDRAPRGEVEPIVRLNRAANAVNLDRLIVARFGAFQQTVVIGWAGSKAEQAKMSASKVMAFRDSPDDVSVQRLSASPLEPYNALLQEIKEQVALEASIPIYAATGTIANVSTETAAMVESSYQRKLRRKHDNWGESWEQAIRVGVSMTDTAEPDESAEVVWDETEARSFAAVVDGMVKIATVPPDGQGVMAHLLDLIPGMSQQRADAIRREFVRGRSASTMSMLAGLAAQDQLPAVGAMTPGQVPDGLGG